MQKSKKRLSNTNNSIVYASENALDRWNDDLNAYYDYISAFYSNMKKIDKNNEKLTKEKQSIINNVVRPTWDEMYMKIAEVVATRSKDPHTKVGAVIVKNNHILGIGYNAEPKGFSYNFDWHSEEKYDYVIHAELNAIANSTYFGNSIAGSTMYLTLSPCCECMKLLIQYGIDTVYYKDTYKDFEKSKKMAKYSNIKLIRFDSR